jgi:hypothetical protein
MEGEVVYEASAEIRERTNLLHRIRCAACQHIGVMLFDDSIYNPGLTGSVNKLILMRQRLANEILKQKEPLEDHLNLFKQYSREIVNILAL